MGASLLEQAVKAVGVERVLRELGDEQNAVQFIWRVMARPEQLPPPGDWLLWLLLAGRGFGKSRTGAEWSREQAKAQPGSHGALIAPTAADARDVMVKALLACTPPEEGLIYEPSKRRVAWKNGTTATLYSAEEPDRLRGPQHHWAWCDELASWQYADEVWDMLAMTMRMGDRPRVVASTTPRPIPLIRRLMKDPATAITRGSTYDNAANLPRTFVDSIRERYDGTRLGRQEVWAEVLDDIEGALWNHAAIDAIRLRREILGQFRFRRVVVAIDPSGSAKKEADEAGIIVAGIAECPVCKGELHAFVLEDLSGRYSPDEMGRKAVEAYHRWHADRLVAEDNFGGQLIHDLIRLIDPRVSYRAVHASRGKIVRAEPVAALYERGRVHHIGMHAKLEDEMCGYAPGAAYSPGRMDAMVWALTDLMLGESRAAFGNASFKPPAATFTANREGAPQPSNWRVSPFGDFADD